MTTTPLFSASRFSAMVEHGGSLAWIASLVSHPHWVLSLILIPSGLSKVVIPFQYSPLPKLWPQFPQWMWPAVGVWELAACGALHVGQNTLAVTLLYSFLGGVYYAVGAVPPPTLVNVPLLKSRDNDGRMVRLIRSLARISVQVGALVPATVTLAYALWYRQQSTNNTVLRIGSEAAILVMAGYQTGRKLNTKT